MNADLEETLNEMGAEYRAVVERMLAPFGGIPLAAEPSPCHLQSSKPSKLPKPRRGRSPRPTKPSKLPKPFLFARPLLAAASLLLVCILAIQLLPPSQTIPTTARPESSPYQTFQTSQTCGRLGTTDPTFQTSQSSTYTLAYGTSAASIAEIVRTQCADGGWGNDFLTRQNAAALRGVADAGVPYRRALRYLRARGLVPLTDDELRMRADEISAGAAMHVGGARS